MGISQNALARAMHVPPRRVNKIVLGKRGITVDSTVRLAAALGTSERFWMALQADRHKALELYWLGQIDDPVACFEHLWLEAQGEEAIQFNKTMNAGQLPRPERRGL